MVDRRFETLSAQTTDYKISTCMCCVSAKYSALSREQRIRIMSTSGLFVSVSYHYHTPAMHV